MSRRSRCGASRRTSSAGRTSTPRPASLLASALSISASSESTGFCTPPAFTSSVSITHGSFSTKPVSLQILVIASAPSCRFRRRTVERVLERLRPDAAIGIDEDLLLRQAKAQIGVDDRLDGIRHPLRLEAAADDLADRGVLVARATKG